MRISPCLQLQEAGAAAAESRAAARADAEDNGTAADERAEG